MPPARREGEGARAAMEEGADRDGGHEEEVEGYHAGAPQGSGAAPSSFETPLRGSSG